jgi:Spy/CpxP family protein refolding chaperone
MRTSIILMFLLSLSALAQGPRDFFPWWDTPVARDINLTDAQQKQVQATVREYRSRLIDVRAGVEKAEGDVADLFNDDQFDTNKANDAVERLVAARSELTRAFSQMSVKLRSVLTAQQWRELEKRRPHQPMPGRMQGPRGNMPGQMPGMQQGPGMRGMPGPGQRQMQQGQPNPQRVPAAPPAPKDE